MKLIAANRDISEIVEKVTLSGDTKQVARKLSFTIARKETDCYLPKVDINAGDQVTMLDDDGAALFGGTVFDVDKTASANVITYLAFDLMFYVLNSDVNKVFDDTPERITEQICAELDVPFGGAAKTGIKVYMPCLGKKGYEGIMMAYTAASRQNDKKYIPLMKDITKLHVIEKGELCGVILDGGYNLVDAKYKTSLQKMVNRVVITDSSGNVVNSVEDAAARKKYGTIQKTYKQEDGKDALTEARAMLFTAEETASVSAVSDIRAVSGYALMVQEPVSGLYGKFYIESDSHTFENGKAQMDLTLAFSNMMDEIEIETKEE